MRTWCHETLRSWGCLIAMRGTRDEKLSNVVINLLIRRETRSSQTVTQIYYAIIQSATCLAPCRVRKIGYIHASHITTEIFGIIWGMLIMLLSFTVIPFFTTAVIITTTLVRHEKDSYIQLWTSRSDEFLSCSLMQSRVRMWPWQWMV